MAVSGGEEESTVSVDTGDAGRYFLVIIYVSRGLVEVHQVREVFWLGVAARFKIFVPVLDASKQLPQHGLQIVFLPGEYAE